MRELRKDPVVDRWVIISSERAARPMDAFHVHTGASDDYCPFCEGEEGATPQEVYAVRPNGGAANGPGWTLRVVPNKYPALGSPGAQVDKVHGMYEKAEGVGYHEVFIETPLHHMALEDMEKESIAMVYGALIKRLAEIRKDPAMVCAQYFKNHGPQAGASLSHAHSQLIAMPVISRALREELMGAARSRIATGECVFCRMLRLELEGAGRLAALRGKVAAIAPFASRFPYEMMILPIGHAERFEDAPDDLVEDFASLLKDILSALGKLFDNPPYNLVLHSAPFNETAQGAFHWHMEVIPIMGRAAGFEWGSGFHINSVPPEEAAERIAGALAGG